MFCMMSCEHVAEVPVANIPLPEPSMEEETLPELFLLEPGTRVGDALVKGWSHPVIRSVPRLGSGAWKSLPGTTRATATRFRTIIAAHLVRVADGYRLEKVGAGNAVPYDGEEVVVRHEGPESVLEQFGLFDRVVLGILESRLQQGRLIARTPTFALFRTPTVMVVDDRHEETALYYALLVDGRSGQLTVLSWATLADDPLTWVTELLELPAGQTFDLALDVQVKRRIGPVPTGWSFAMPEMPPGRSIASTVDWNVEELTSPELERILRGLAFSRNRSNTD